MISRKSKLADIVNKNMQLLPFLRRIGLKLGFGDKSIEDICKENGINIDFMLELMQLIIKKYDFNPRYIDNFETGLTIEYLKNSHFSYVNESLPKIEELIKNLFEIEREREDDLKALLSFFNNYKFEFHKHINHEDQKIFPYIIEIEKHYKNNNFSNEIKDLIKQNTIRNYIKQHDSLNEQLDDLKNLLIKYFHPFENELLCHALINSLFDLENDLKDHELIENQILFPQVFKLEQRFLNNEIE